MECVTFSGGDFEYDPKNALPVANYSSEIEYEEDGGYIGGQHLDQLRLRVAGAFKSKLEQREKIKNRVSLATSTLLQLVSAI